MKNFKLILLLLLFSCTKERIEQESLPCTECLLISDKYLPDSTFIKKDTLWQDCISGHWLDTLKKTPEQWFVNCDTRNIEHWYYIIKPR